jgi:hypothetical protein
LLTASDFVVPSIFRDLGSFRKQKGQKVAKKEQKKNPFAVFATFCRFCFLKERYYKIRCGQEI